MKLRKFTRQEKHDNRVAFVTKAMAGTGLFLYENSSRHAELTLPRPTASGVHKIGPSKQFQGDDYYMQLVKTGDLRLIKVLQQVTPDEPVPTLEEIPMNEQTLILDQPARITTKGTVESVIDNKQPLREAANGEPQQDVLINESPVEGAFIIVT